MKSMLRAAWPATAALALALGAIGGARVSADDKHGPIPWMESFANAKKAAVKQKKVLMLDFWATWCGPCKQMLSTTYRDPAVVASSRRFVPVLVDVDKQQDLARRYNVSAIPTVVFINAKGKVLVQNVGYVGPQEFLKLMNQAKRKAGS